jgi:hypothetical protein
MIVYRVMTVAPSCDQNNVGQSVLSEIQLSHICADYCRALFLNFIEMTVGLDMYRECKKIPKRVLYMNLQSTRPRGRPRNR